MCSWYPAINMNPAGGGIVSGGAASISEERCGTILSKGAESLGEYDFYYEWFQKPSVSQVEGLITKIDEALEGTGVRYTLTTK